MNDITSIDEHSHQTMCDMVPRTTCPIDTSIVKNKKTHNMKATDTQKKHTPHDMPPIPCPTGTCLVIFFYSNRQQNDPQFHRPRVWLLQANIQRRCGIQKPQLSTPTYVSVFYVCDCIHIESVKIVLFLFVLVIFFKHQARILCLSPQHT